MKRIILILCTVISQTLFGSDRLDTPPKLESDASAIVSVEVQNIDDEILINWESPANPGELNFEVERASGRCSELSFEKIGKPNYAVMNTKNSFDYFFVDNKPVNGRAFYRIKLIDKNENVFYSEYIEIKPAKENKLNIDHFYQNGRNKTIEFEFSVPEEGMVLISIYNSDGETIDTITNKIYGTGEHSICYKASNLEEGTYFYSIEQGNEIITKQIKF